MTKERRLMLSRLRKLLREGGDWAKLQAKPHPFCKGVVIVQRKTIHAIIRELQHEDTTLTNSQYRVLRKAAVSNMRIAWDAGRKCFATQFRVLGCEQGVIRLNFAGLVSLLPYLETVEDRLYAVSRRGRDAMEQYERVNQC